MHDEKSRAPAADPFYWLASAGLAMILVGQPIAWFIRGAVGGGKNPAFPIVAVLIGLTLLILARAINRVRFEGSPLFVMVMVCGYLLPVVGFSLLDTELMAVDGLYGLFTAIVLVLVAGTPRRELATLPTAIAVLGAVGSVLPIYGLVTGKIADTFSRLGSEGNENPIVISYGAAATIFASIVVLTTNQRPSLLRGLLLGFAVAAGLAALVLSNTRSVMIGVIVWLPVYLVLVRPRTERREHSRRVRARTLQSTGFLAVVAAGVVLAPTAALIVLGPKIFDGATAIAQERIEGAYAIFAGDDSGQADASSRERVEVIKYSYNHISLWGEGVNAMSRRAKAGVYPHFTYLQAFYDAGLPGALWFTLLAFVLPAAVILRRYLAGPFDVPTAFITIYYCYSHIDNFTHGTPYSWLALMPIGLVYAVVPRPPLVSDGRFRGLPGTTRGRAVVGTPPAALPTARTSPDI